MKSGSLTVVGTGYNIAGQVTQESLAIMRSAGKLYHVVSNSLTEGWLAEVNPTAESLSHLYVPGQDRYETYLAMVKQILAPVREGLQVCAAFYGHPGVFVTPAREAIRRARKEGYPARMLPGISAEDCLFADVGLDPGVLGCQTFEASDFMIHRRRFDPRSPLILLQIGAAGVFHYTKDPRAAERGVRVLVEVLQETYPADHEVIAYETAPLPVLEPIIRTLPLAELPGAEWSMATTLYVPPGEPSRKDPEMLERLGIEVSAGASEVAGREPGE